MHESSLRHMRRLVDTYLKESSSLTIADLGAMDINGCYRSLFERPNWRYIGIDLSPGPNVDCVLNSPYRLPFANNSIDLFISGQAFEHIEFFWLTWLEMARIVKPGGLIFLIAPSRGPQHRYPVDCWRFYPDGFAALAKYAAMDLLEVHTDWEPNGDPDSALWGDTVGVFRKRLQSASRRLINHITRYLRYWSMPGFRH